MVVNLVLLKEKKLQQYLMNLKMFFLIKKVIRHKMKRIQAKNHKIGTYEIDKISSSCFDDKRFVLDDGIHTLAYFLKDCNKKCDKNENENNK